MEWLLLAAGLLLILGTGFFVAVEFSLVALDQATVQRAVDNGDTAAVPLLKCLKSLSTQLSSCQLGITMTTLLTGYVMEPSVGQLLKGPLTALGLPEAAAASVSPGHRDGGGHPAVHADRRTGARRTWPSRCPSRSARPSPGRS